MHLLRMKATYLHHLGLTYIVSRYAGKLSTPKFEAEEYSYGRDWNEVTDGLPRGQMGLPVNSGFTLYLDS